MATATAEPVLHTQRLRLCAPRVEQAAAVADYLARNRDHFAPWDPPTSEEAFTTAFQRGALRDAARAFADATAYRYWLYSAADLERIVGSIHFTQIARGAFHSSTVGYGLDRASVGAGLMTEALAAAVAAMFSPTVNLHRIQASTRPDNRRSKVVLNRLGFHAEGMARDYLYIDGAWRDHCIFARLNPDFAVPREWPAK